jgi:hypothetical protein
VQPVFVLAEQIGDVADREDGCDRRQDVSEVSLR